MTKYIIEKDGKYIYRQGYGCHHSGPDIDKAHRYAKEESAENAIIRMEGYLYPIMRRAYTIWHVAE